jgi:predicted RNA-binding Zn-ribbon protein involved in translation (DUF1610 family)
MTMWTTSWWCVACHGRLTEHETAYSHGRCPLCGHKDAKACTFVATYEKAEPVRRPRFVQRLVGEVSPLTAAAFLLGMAAATALIKLGYVVL